jgi:hypothetical protein
MLSTRRETQTFAVVAYDATAAFTYWGIYKGSASFAAAAETLHHALIRAGREGHKLVSASITGLYSVVAPAD